MGGGNSKKSYDLTQNGASEDKNSQSGKKTAYMKHTDILPPPNPQAPAKSTPAASKPAEAKPPAQSKPAASNKPTTNTKQAETKPAASTTPAAKPTEKQPAVATTTAAATKPAETKPAASTTPAAKPTEKQPSVATTTAAATKPAETKPADSKEPAKSEATKTAVAETKPKTEAPKTSVAETTTTNSTGTTPSVTTQPKEKPAETKDVKPTETTDEKGTKQAEVKSTELKNDKAGDSKDKPAEPKEVAGGAKDAKPAESNKRLSESDKYEQIDTSNYQKKATDSDEKPPKEKSDKPAELTEDKSTKSKDDKLDNDKDDKPTASKDEKSAKSNEKVVAFGVGTGAAVDNDEDSEGENMYEVVNAPVCKVDDLEDGEMREVDVGDGKALLIKDNGKFHAVGHKCTHYGAPLVKGAYCDGRVRCPWHGACFSVTTGDIEDFPGLDSLQKFDVEIVGDTVNVKATKNTLTTLKRVKHMSVAKEEEDSRVFLIIGGGGAGNNCAETLRQEGFKGKVIVAGKEASLPYDRPKLSKAMTSSAEELELRNKDFYEWSNISVLTNKEAVSVDAENKSVTFKDGDKISYNKLFVATGGSPRTLPTPGADLENICILRTPADANRIAGLAKDKNVVIIGTSFIGMEAASCLAEVAKTLTTVDLVDVPFKLVLGDQVGRALQKLHEEKGTRFYLKQSVKEFVGKGGKLNEVVLQDDTRLPADLCLIGIGVFPTTDFLKTSGIDLSDRGFINVDKCMATSKADIYAGGDIVSFPLFINDDTLSNVQHWQMANQHGHIAALNMVGKKTEIHSVPFFWTVQFGKSLRYTGYGLGYDDIVLHGDLDELKFIAYYTKGEKVIAVASLNYDPYVAKAAEFMTAGKTIMKNEIQNDALGWEKRY